MCVMYFPLKRASEAEGALALGARSAGGATLRRQVAARGDQGLGEACAMKSVPYEG